MLPLGLHTKCAYAWKITPEECSKVITDLLKEEKKTKAREFASQVSFASASLTAAGYTKRHRERSRSDYKLCQERRVQDTVSATHQIKSTQVLV